MESVRVTLGELIGAAVSGKLRVEGGGPSEGSLVTAMVSLGPEGPDGLTAEAYRIGALDYRTVPWEEGLAEVKALLRERHRPETG